MGLSRHQAIVLADLDLGNRASVSAAENTELRGIGLLTGEVGCRKTTVCRHVTANLRC